MLNLRETHLFIRVSVENDVCLRSYEQKNFYYPNKMKQDMKATRHGTGSCGLPQVPTGPKEEKTLSVRLCLLSMPGQDNSPVLPA